MEANLSLDGRGNFILIRIPTSCRYRLFQAPDGTIPDPAESFRFTEEDNDPPTFISFITRVHHAINYPNYYTSENGISNKLEISRDEYRAEGKDLISRDSNLEVKR